MKDEILDDFSFIDEDFSLYEISNNQRTLIFISVFIIYLNTCKYIFDVFFLGKQPLHNTTKGFQYWNNAKEVLIVV